MEAFERALQEQPGNPALLEIVIWYLLEAGYIEDALPLAERFVDLEPLLPSAHQNLSDTLYALGRTGDAIAAMEVTDQLSGEFAKWSLGDFELVEKQDDIAITYLEGHLEKSGLPSGWVRELVTAARDPATGQAALDRRIPEILASVPPDYAPTLRWGLLRWYVIFGFLDRHFELLLDFDFSESAWAEADVPVQGGTLLRHLGYTAHPKYLEVAELLGLVELWEHRGPPDFCEKLGDQWVCE
jgi:tetratricopeptide (TPR) repeat protein